MPYVLAILKLWLPNAMYSGDDMFEQNVFNALNSLYKNIQETGAGNVKTKEAKGNVILDFAFSKDKDVEIMETSGTSNYQKDGTLNWNPGEGLFITKPEKSHIKAKNDISGNVSPITALAHEFAHAWLQNFSPALRTIFRNSHQADAEENNFVLKVERSFVRGRGETGYRFNYNPAEWPEDLKSRHITQFKDGNRHVVKVDLKKRF